MKAFTPFGKFVRDLMQIHNDTGIMLANKLNCSPSHLSAVLHGRRSIPTKWLVTLAKVYELTEIQISQLQQAYNSSSEMLKIDLTQLNDNQRELAILFCHRLSKLTTFKIEYVKYFLLK